MKVKDLIEMLKEFDSEAEIRVIDSYGEVCDIDDVTHQEDEVYIEVE
jgi:hypothetical protein